jgi:adenosylhomocysteine nucleosidase
MPKPLIVMALAEEGQGKLEPLGFEVLYCGVGKVNAVYHLTRTLYEAAKRSTPYSHVLNLGSAGSPSFNCGTLVAADRFVQRDMDATGLGFALGQTPFEQDEPMITAAKIFDHLPHGICGSGDSFLQGISPIPSDIIDMEAYALAKVCSRESIPFSCVKYITDGADKSAANDWQANLALAAQAFVDLLTYSGVKPTPSIAARA